MGRKKKGGRAGQGEGSSSSDKPTQPVQTQEIQQSQGQAPQERGGQGDGPSGSEKQVESAPGKQQAQQSQILEGSQQQKKGKRGRRGQGDQQRTEQGQGDPQRSEHGQGDVQASQALPQQREHQQSRQQVQHPSQIQPTSVWQGQQLLQHSKGQPPQGQPLRGQPPQGQPPRGQPPQGQPPRGQPPQGQPPQGQPPQGQPAQGQPPQGQPPRGQPPQGQPPRGQPPQGQPPHAQPPPLTAWQGQRQPARQQPAQHSQRYQEPQQPLWQQPAQHSQRYQEPQQPLWQQPAQHSQRYQEPQQPLRQQQPQLPLQQPQQHQPQRWQQQQQQPQQQQQQPQQQPQQPQQQQQQQYSQRQQFPQGQQRGGPQGYGRGRKQQEAPRQSTPASQPTSPYSMTPSSSTSSISQGSRDQPSEMMQRMSIASEASVMPRTRETGGDAAQLLPQISPVERKGGTAGRQKIQVITNHFPLNIGKLQTAIHYDVAITPDRPKKLFRTVMEEFRKKRYSNRWPAYDGNKNLYSSSALFESIEISDSVNVIEDEKSKEYEVTVKFATYVDLTCLQNYSQRVRGKSILEMEKPMQALQCLDIVLRSAPALSCIPVGRSYFTRPRQPYVLGDGCVLYHGFYQAAILGWKPYVNIDVAHKAFPMSLNMIDLVREMNPRADINQELTSYDRESLNKHMRQLKIQYELPKNPASRRVYRVNQLDVCPRKATFKDDAGKTMTVEQYFTQVKKINLRYPNLPTLWVGSRARENKILLPFELCVVLPDQAVNKKMTEQQTRNMIKQAATNTTIRKENIKRAIESANYNGSNTMREFGISVNPTPQEVEARILFPPQLQYNKKMEKVFKGTWRAGQFRESATLTNWSILCLDSRTRDEGLQNLGQELMRNATNYGMKIDRPAQFTRLTDRNLSADLRRYFSDNKHYQMVVVVLSQRSDCYNHVKQASEIAIGCLTQCLKPNTVYKLNRSTVDNILLKINAKLNGLNHSLADLPACLQRPCMIMGADVTHPGPDAKDFPSVAAVTASIDVSAFKYRFEWRLQQSRQEMIEDLEEITRQHLLNFYRTNHNAKPEKILYVRDGVSDGQFTQVLNVELMAIRAACQRLDPNYKPPIIFIVVQKRHHTRFFPKDTSVSEDRNLNVPAGTCVDTEITHPTIVDFYLVSHASIQGVAKPTKYVKLWDDCKMSEDELEKLMYYLCHMFARCNRSVSYPAPTYYAHLAAARARVYCEIERIDMSNLQGEQRRLTIKENIAKGLPMFFV